MPDRIQVHSCDPWCTWRNCADQERAHGHPGWNPHSCEACDFLSCQDPHDAENRLAHDLPYDATAAMLCRRGCGLDYRAIYSGKVGHCPAWPWPPYDADDVPEHAFDDWMAAWEHIGLINAISRGWYIAGRQLVANPHEDMGAYRDVRLQMMRRLINGMDPSWLALFPTILDLAGPGCVNYAYWSPSPLRCGEVWCPRHG